MKYIEDKIKECGKVLSNDVLKIDNFLNHQIDMECLHQIGKGIYEEYKDFDVTKILTIEASGIAIGVETAHFFNDCPVVFAKKSNSLNMSDDKYQAKVYSYTRQEDCFASVAKEYLCKEDKVLIVDDFLAKGSASCGLVSICQQAGCQIIGCCVVVEKMYQGGREALNKMGIEPKALARIKNMSVDNIEFYND